MKSERDFIIKLTNVSGSTIGYIKTFNKTQLGYIHTITLKINKANTWKYKKCCEKALLSLINNPDPTKNKYYIENCIFSIIEITDIIKLRKLKLNRLKKK